MFLLLSLPSTLPSFFLFNNVFTVFVKIMHAYYKRFKQYSRSIFHFFQIAFLVSLGLPL